MNQVSQTRLCPKCGAEQEWYECKLHGKTRGQWKCRECQRQYKKNWEVNNPEKVKASRTKWKEENPERRREIQRAYYARNKERISAYHAQRYIDNKEEMLEVRREWKKANPEKCREIGRRNRVQNKERYRQKLNRWRAENPQRFRAQWLRRRARMMEAGPNFATTAEIQERMAIGECVYCGATHDLTVDHIVPLAGGGMHVKSNLAPACGKCNFSKQDRLFEEWFRSQPFFSKERWHKLLELMELSPDVD